MQMDLFDTNKSVLQTRLSSIIMSQFNKATKAAEYTHGLKTLCTPGGRMLLAVTAQAQANICSWPTPNVAQGGPNSRRKHRNAGGPDLQEAAQTVGWPTPTVTDGTKRGAVSPRDGAMGLAETVPLAGWATPTVRDDKDRGDMSGSMVRRDGKQRNDTLGRQTFGLPLSSCHAETDGRGVLNPAFSRSQHGVLNPAFSRWLMGLRVEWCIAAILARRSMPTIRRKRVRCD